MTKSMPWSTLFNIIGVVGGVCGIVSLLYGIRQTSYARQQTKLMQDDIRRRERDEKQESEWAEKHERLASQLLKLRSPGLTIEPPGLAATTLYPSIFPDVKLREAMETYVVGLNSGGTQFVRREAPRPDELRLAVVRETIRKAEQCMADFQKGNPKIDLTYYMGFRAL